MDIGSGTGASIIGILDYFAQNNLHGNIKITVYSVDGNENALQYQNKLFQSCLENSKLKAELIQTCKKFPLQEKDFKAELYDIMEEFDQTYDIIITSKFLSELYDVKNKNARNLYFNFASVASEYLCRDSLLILSDVTIRTQAEFIPIIMKKELHEFSKKEKSKLHKGSRRLQYVLPLSCAFWHQKCRNYENCFTQKIFNVSHSQKEVDKSKITLNVFSQKSIVEKILHHADEKDKYFCNAQKPNQACCKGKLEHFNNLNDSERLDGFSLQ